MNRKIVGAVYWPEKSPISAMPSAGNSTSGSRAVTEIGIASDIHHAAMSTAMAAVPRSMWSRSDGMKKYTASARTMPVIRPKRLRNSSRGPMPRSFWPGDGSAAAPPVVFAVVAFFVDIAVGAPLLRGRRKSPGETGHGAGLNVIQIDDNRFTAPSYHRPVIGPLYDAAPPRQPFGP